MNEGDELEPDVLIDVHRFLNVRSAHYSENETHKASILEPSLFD